MPPLENLGLVVIDEEQEYTYKSENVPKYHARDVAKFRCAQSGALLLLGSATPSVESMYLAETGVYHLFSLPERYNRKALPGVFIADMKQELPGGQQHHSGPATAPGAEGEHPGGGAEHPLSQPPGGQPDGELRRVRRGAHLSPLLRASDHTTRPMDG